MSCRGSSLVMRVGPIVTTLKRNCNRQNGGVFHFHDRRRHDRVSDQSKACSSCFLGSETLERARSSNKEFDCDVLKHLWVNIRRKRLDLWSAKNWILHDDVTPCHRAIEFLADNMVFLYLPHSSDLAPANFHLFPVAKKSLS